MFASRISQFSVFSVLPKASGTSSARYITKSIYAAERPEGMGAIVRRSLGTREMRHHDPFLLLDEFYLNPEKSGFPDHPHRGFETVTYMLRGQMQHEDFSGHKGTIGPGDLQWMTAGRGIIEKEEEEEDMIHGLQLWVNLSHADKLCEPAYQGLRDSQIPRARPSEGVEVKIIAGEAHGVQSRVYTRTPTMYLDYQMKKNKSVDVNIPRDYNGFIYMLSGRAYFGDRGSAANIIDSSNNSTLHIQIKDESTHFVVLAGRPLKEPVVQDRLFVLNSKEEVKQTLEDYREFKNGFENAKQWRSTIGPRAYRLKF
ncbi:RmlC-like cupin domain-containing protein [Lobosporangium transversale]|uniref:RmlC-like cupin domain-containing protein n=1 Tax=Lobosporangium transversale TaxID=64571 RepID=A0A1Y2GJ03_9FUNG|nr:RmlC-like cupin domain-containing protein [Lobosporangium transversale]ORZ08817.1 RmlC-like cupin domain-containing protein [Lobosporangium transversale]|eukprot:XP_021878600.1 RmlC-like cupin domain-containing protein [Lobosporangium transversale]